VVDAQVFGERVHVTLAEESGAIEERFRAALHGTALAGASVRQVQPSLEDVFIAQLSGDPPSPLRGFGEASREKVSG
jgi:hypothetical protein